MKPEALSARGSAAQENGNAPQPSLELLVHGVGGATPAEMLGDPRTELVTGDKTAGIHRCCDDVGAEDGAARGGKDRAGPDRPDGEPVQEAYCWSGLTSGNGARALWLVLLPFMVANLVHWMRPAAPAGSRWQAAYDVLVRLLALTLTVQLVLAAGEVTLDLLAWQCAGSAHCVADKSWLGFMAADSGGFFAGPGRRLALAALVPALLTGLLWSLSHRTWNMYESARPWPRTRGRVVTVGEERATLSLPGFWYGRRHVARLRAAHTAAGLLAVATALVAVVLKADEESGAGGLRLAGWLLAAAVAAGWAAVLAVVVTARRSEREPDLGEDRALVGALPGAALAVLAATIGYAAWARPEWVSAGRLPGSSVFGWLAVAQGLLAAGLAAAGWVLQRRASGGRPALRGLAGACVALLAGALAGVLSGGVTQRAADWLDRGATPGEGTVLAGPPVVLSWQATVIPLVVALVLLLALAGGVRLWFLGRRLVGEVAGMYPDEKSDRAADPRTRRIARVIARAQLTDDAPPMIGVAAVATLVLGTGAVLGAWLTGEVAGEAARGAPGPIPALAQTGQAMGSWMMGAGVILLVAMGRRAYIDPSARRTVGILWDVGTFWPRAAHPFAPPCYAERAVPDLAWRMNTWSGRTGGQLVISGHSQGSVLAAAAVWQLDADIRDRVALLTYGSPLRRLYGRWFPAYFGDSALEALDAETYAWRNLWRLTDPIGGPVRPGGDRPSDVDCGPLKDPLAFERTAEHPLPAAVNAHSDYQADPAFAVERAELLARLAPGPAAPPEPPVTASLPGPAPEPETVGPAPEPTAPPTAQGSAGMSSG